MSKYADIIAKLGLAPGHDYKLDHEIAFLTEFRPQNDLEDSFSEHERKHDYQTSWIAHRPWLWGFGIPNYTESVDAATGLVEKMLPGWGHDVYWNNCQGHLARVEDNANTHEGSTGREWSATGATAAIALLLAMFRALDEMADYEPSESDQGLIPIPDGYAER